MTRSLTLLILLTACATPRAEALRTASAPAGLRGPLAPSPRSDATKDLGEASVSTLADYQLHALAHAPRVQAAYARWEAAVAGVSVAGRLPEPTISYGLFLRSIETRVGPQRQSLAIAQSLPWPQGVKSGIDAASERARASARQLEATALRVEDEVAQAYWALWSVRAQREVVTAQVTISEGLLEQTRRQVELGSASLASLSRRESTHLRLLDRREGLSEAEYAAAAALRAVVGLDPDSAVPTETSPLPPREPISDEANLREHLNAHPAIASLALQGDASAAVARQRGVERLPTLGLSASWIDLGPARLDGVPDSGKDAVVVGVSMRVPLAVRSLKAGVDSARAEASAFRAEAQAAEDRAEADLAAALVRVRDTGRRARLFYEGLLPRAEDTLASLRGSTDADAGLQLLLARQDLLEMKVEAAVVAAEHERAWATLEQVLGRAIDPARTEVSP